MCWWYDPIHFNAAAGNVILRLLAGETVADAPENMMRLVTPSTVDAVLKERRDGMQRWIQRNPDNYVTEFEQAKFATGNDKRPAH